MLKKTIKYVDFNDESLSEDFYFNLTKAELTELELSIRGGFSTRLEYLLNSRDIPALMDFFKLIILKSYGEKSPDGKYFNKSPEISHQFSCCAAYDALFMELLESNDNVLAFIKAIVPKDFADTIKSATIDAGTSTPVLSAGA